MGAVAAPRSSLLPPEAGLRVKRRAVSAVALAIPLEEPLDGLRRRLAAAGGDARGAVLADLVEDDLCEVEGALRSVTRYLATVGKALGELEAGRGRLLRLALEGGPMEELERLESTLASLRRRLARVAVRLPP